MPAFKAWYDIRWTVDDQYVLMIKNWKDHVHNEIANKRSGSMLRGLKKLPRWHPFKRFQNLVIRYSVCFFLYSIQSFI